MTRQVSWVIPRQVSWEKTRLFSWEKTRQISWVKTRQVSWEITWHVSLGKKATQKTKQDSSAGKRLSRTAQQGKD
jgi:hypothetical protein